MTVSEVSGGARERLLDAALRRFDSDGVLSATLQEIRAEARVSVGALYHHFADKQALAGALYLDTLGRFQEGFGEVLDSHAGAEEGVRAIVEHVIDWCLANPARARLLFSGQQAADPLELTGLNRSFFEHTRRWYATHVHYGAVRPMPSKLLAALWLGPTFEYLRQPSQKIDRATRTALADAAWRNLAKEPQ